MKVVLVVLAALLLIPATASATITATATTPLAVPYNAAIATVFTTDTAQQVQLNDNAYWVTDKVCPTVTVKRGTVRRVCNLAAGESVTYAGPARVSSTYTYAQSPTSTDFASITYTLTTSPPDPYVYTFWRSGCRPWLPGSCV